MRSLIIVFVMVFALSMSSFAFAKGPGKICNDNDDFGFDHDTCVVCVAQGFPETLTATCFCKGLQDLYVLDFFDLSLGDCISYVNTEVEE